MLDYSSEHVIPVNDVPKHVPGRPSLRTVWRWTEKGARGAKLETLLVGGRRVTSLEAIRRFLTAINSPKTPSVSQSARRQRAIEQAEHELNEAGI
jgi:hypothetical protein